MLSRISNPLTEAWKAAGDRAAETWDAIADELAEVRVKDIEATLKVLSGISDEDVSLPAVRLAAFCYGACAGPLNCRTELKKRAALTLQRLLIVGQADEETLPLALEAAERFPLHLPRERYLSAKSIAQSAAANYAYFSMFARKKSLDQESHERLEAARENCRRACVLRLAAARELHRIQTSEWMGLFAALEAAARCEQTAGEWARARELLCEAIELAQEWSQPDRSDHLRLIAKTEVTLGEVLAEHDEQDAMNHLKKAEGFLRHAWQGGDSEAPVLLAEVLTEIADLAHQRGDSAGVCTRVDAAIEALEQSRQARAGASATLRPLTSLVDDLNKKDAEPLRGGIAALLDSILAEQGVIQAAHAGHAAAAEIVEIEWHDILSEWRHLTYEDEPMTRIEDPLIRLLNLDPDIVEMRMNELAAERDAAVAHPGTVSLPGLTDVPRFQQSWERWCAVRILQRLADTLIPPDEAPCDVQQLIVRRNKVRLRGMTIRENEALHACLCRAELASDVSVAAGWPGEESGLINYQLPDEDYYAGPLSQEQQVDMIVCLQQTAGVDTSPLDVWIRECLRLLVGHALVGRDTIIDQEIQLGRCLMPAAGQNTGAVAMQDHLLGEADPPAVRCNRWYTRHRGTKETCGSQRCMDIASRTTDDALSARALDLAERYCKSLSPDFMMQLHDMWEDAVDRNGPAGALQKMKELINE